MRKTFWLPFTLSRVLFLSLVAAAIPAAANSPSADSSDPWTAAQILQPAQLADELKQDTRPLIIYVGVRTLYNGGHIPGAAYHGPGSTEQGIAELKKYAATLPKDSNLVIYCGCCPLEKCPNLRPAFRALRELDFTKVRVLILPRNFNDDWVKKGYPVEKGS